MTSAGLMLAAFLNITFPATAAPADAPASAPKPAEPSLTASQSIARLYFAYKRAAQPWTNYAGDAACLPCHKDMVHSYHQTDHYLASSWPTKETIHGSFSPGSNILRTANADLYFQMESNAHGFFQTAVQRISPSDTTQYVARIDIIFGSGRKAQTFSYWRDGRLYELPVSHWTDRGVWMNSPSALFYPDGTANFGRGITPRCLECHATSFEWLNPFQGPDASALPFNKYTNLVLGITCERCHGNGQEHIARMRSPAPPKSPSAMAIVNPARLPRDRQMDVCGLCHAGAGNELGPALAFNAGDVLSNVLEIQLSGPDTPIDVHGNQVQSLERSRCFRSSPSMTCTTCHDVHTPQRDLNAFAQKCLACHHVENCKQFHTLGHVIDHQCVTCHMPVQQTHAVQAVTKGESFQPTFRNHLIAIYPDVRLP